MASSCANFAEHAQFRWQRLSKESLPRFGSKTHDAGKAPFKIPKLHCAHQRRKIRTEGPQDRAIAGARVYCRDQEDRGASKRRGYWLRNDPRAVHRSGCAHRIAFHVNLILAARAVLKPQATRVRTHAAAFCARRQPARSSLAVRRENVILRGHSRMARKAASDDTGRIGLKRVRRGNIVKHGVCPSLRVRESLAVLLDKENVL